MVVKTEIREKSAIINSYTGSADAQRVINVLLRKKNRLGWGHKIIGNINVVGEGGGGAMGGTTMPMYYDYLSISLMSYRHKQLCFDT